MTWKFGYMDQMSFGNIEDFWNPRNKETKSQEANNQETKNQKNKKP